MKHLPTKISLFLLTIILISSCNAVKRLEADQYLLIDNNIFLSGEEVKENEIYSLLYQEPNSGFLGYPFQLHLYNLGKPNPDSLYTTWIRSSETRKNFLIDLLSQKQVVRLGNIYVNINQWFRRSGEPPAIVDSSIVDKSAERLKSWYWNKGWFNTTTDYEIIPQENQRAIVNYYVHPGEPYFIDTLKTNIDSEVADSIYRAHRLGSEIEPGTRYESLDFDRERERLTNIFRNNGLYYFEQEYITFEADTVNTGHHLNAILNIANYEATVDAMPTRLPYKVRRISDVNIFPDFTFENRNDAITDTATYNGFHIYAFDELKYRPGALTNAIFISPGSIYSDRDRTLTYNRVNQLRTFKYPDIQYMEDPNDTTNTNLIANIFLTPLKKYSLEFEFDISQSNIQEFGIGFGGVLLIRNVFNGGEILEISGRGSIGSSKDAANDKDTFFDITEIGTDISLTLPRILFPVQTEEFIPKYMYPFTTFSIGASSQRNIGLDKQNLNAIMSYRWYPTESLTHIFELINIQYVRNLNTANYFNIYRNSFSRLNEIATAQNVMADERYFDIRENGTFVLDIPEGADQFLQDTRIPIGFGLTDLQLQTLNDIRERKNRLTEDNLIFASNFSYIHNSKEDIYDEDFSRLRIKLESAGNFLSGLSKVADLKKTEDGRYSIFGVNFSQYVKTEIDYIKHWDLGSENVFAIRTFGGIAVPYGNSNSIPFSRSFFAGGPNDNRAWEAYSLGPGSSGGRNEFNEANMKIALSAEYRFNLFGDLNSALFIDAGNIWNIWDVVENEAATFTSLSDLKEIAIGTGFGLRYDFDFFVLRLDIGFKTYNPARPPGQRWFGDYDFSHAVYNVGINYPF